MILSIIIHMDDNLNWNVLETQLNLKQRVLNLVLLNSISYSIKKNVTRDNVTKRDNVGSRSNQNHVKKERDQRSILSK